MNDVITIFYKQIIPGMLQGEIDCELPARILSNVYFEEENQLLEATKEYEGVIIPTLIIKNKERFNQILIDYVEAMLTFYGDFKFSCIDPCYYTPYLIATAIANMGKDDYLNPEFYFQNRTEAIKNNPFSLSSVPVPVCNSAEFNSDLYYILDKEKPNEEAPFKYTLYATNEENSFEFQTIRFYILNDTAYIGAIQGNKPEEKTAYQKKIKRILYKANEGITPDNELYQTNPGAVVALTSFIALLNSFGINKITILPYGLQRWNDKKILYHNLSDKVINNSIDESRRLKVEKVIERTSSYFDKSPIIRTQLQNCLLRFYYHLTGSELSINKDEPLITCGQIANGNNTLLNNIYGAFSNQNLSIKKTNHED
ncbi:MAG: hypothetical protein E7167_03445 [Firmicutes bacterium]|nr:hypothetical protein [Bacillota bacterium]